MHARDLNYHHLRLFQAVVRSGSVAAAARELHLTPQTVSEQVRALEETLGVVLLDRSRRRVRPTDTGRLVAGYADDIFDRGREMVEAVQQQDAERPLRLAIGVVNDMPKAVACHLLEPAFVAQARVHVNVREGPTESLLAALAVHELDAILTDAPAPAGLRLRTFDHLLGSSGVSLVAPADLARRLRRGFPSSMDGAPVLLPRVGSTLHAQFTRWCERTGVQPAVVGQFDDSALAKEVAAAGIGAIVVPSVVVDEVRRRHALRTVAELDGLEERFYVVSPERRIVHPAVQAIVDGARGAYLAG